MPRYVLEDVPSVLVADFTNPNVSQHFNNTFIVGDKAWSGPEQMIIDEYGYDLHVQVLSGQEEFVAMLEERYSRSEPMLFFLWSPNPLMSKYDLVRITLPEHGKFVVYSSYTRRINFREHSSSTLSLSNFEQVDVARL